MEIKSNKTPITNIHTHIFTNKHIPIKFINLLQIPLVPLLHTSLVIKIINFTAAVISKIKGWLPFISINLNHEYIDRISRLLSIAGHDTQGSILQILRAHYPPKTKFVILPMNMKYMGAGKVTANYDKQILELKKLYAQYPDSLIPFYHVDPRQENIVAEVRDCVIKGPFKGIKLYPSLGYFPFPFPNAFMVNGKNVQTSHPPMAHEDRLEDIYTMAEKNQIPIITHVTPGGILGRLRKYKFHPITGRKMSWYQSRASYVYNFAHPYNYEYLLQKFPKLKICLAHFGSQLEWKRHLVEPLIHRDSEILKEQNDILDKLKNSELIYPAWNPTKRKVEELSWLSVIRNLISKYENVYADISYNAYTPDTLALLMMLVNDPSLKEKILFGTDFHVLRIEKSEKEFSIGMRAFIGEENFNQIARVNPEKFLS